MDTLVDQSGRPLRRSTYTTPPTCPICDEELTKTMGGGGACMKPACGGFTATAEELREAGQYA